MRRRLSMQAGFSVVEGLIVVVVLVAVGGAGYFALNRAAKDDNARNTTPTATDQSVADNKAEDTPEAPEITTADDLTNAQKTLDSADFNGEDSELDAQLNGF